MKITTRDVDGVLVVDMAGKLDTQTSGEAADEMSRIGEGGPSKVLVNLEALEFISSAGLRVLLRTAKSLRAKDGVLNLCAASGLVKEVMDISGFEKLLDMLETEVEALGSF